MLYDGLDSLAPSLVARINRAIAVLHVRGAAAALDALDDLAADPRIAAYQPYWAARAHVLALSGRTNDATICYDRAIALESDEAVKEFLKQKLQSLINASI